ncbi:MAG: hypothetical protein JNG86_18810 [Verrucomicrobiaceae bacterium]|nr:hypothetical protein [Verrucomicrobiaceae bacterium]
MSQVLASRSFFIDQDAKGAAIGRGDAVEVEAFAGEFGGEGAIGLFFGLELLFAARGLVAEGLWHTKVGEDVAVDDDDDVSAVVALMHGVFEQRGYGQLVRGEVGGPVAVVFGLAPQRDVALAPVNAGHVDVGGGVACTSISSFSKSAGLPIV